jgi:hypothetical protein
VPVWVFRFGDIFDPDDPLSVWICTLGIAFNDVIYSNVKVEAATKAWERFYGWRVAIGHFNEAALHLERGREIAEVVQFLESEGEVKERYEDVLRRYGDLRGLTNRFRNEAAFHYPYESGRVAVAEALGELADEEGAVGGIASTKIRDLRQFYADDVVAHLVFNASGGSEAEFEEAASALGDAVSAFGRFANVALDLFFTHHQEAMRLGDASAAEGGTV